VTGDRDQAGSIFIEYLLIMSFFSLPIAAACLQLGFPLLRLFRYAQVGLAGPIP